MPFWTFPFCSAILAHTMKATKSNELAAFWVAVALTFPRTGLADSGRLMQT